MHRCPNPALRIPRAGDSDQLGTGACRHRGRRRGDDSPACGPKVSSARCLGLYKLTKDQLLELDGFGEISAIECNRGYSAVERRRPVLARSPWSEHPRRRLGHRAQPLVLTSEPSMLLQAAGQEDVQQVEGIRPNAPRPIVEWFADEQNRDLVAELQALKLRFEARPGSDRGRPADRQHVCHHRDAGVDVARAGRGGARRAGREDHERRLGEDDRADRRRGTGQLEADEGAKGRHADRRRSRAC